MVNNGAAGMPNFRERCCGIVTRIGVTPAPTPILYGATVGGVRIEALALDYDGAAWEREFLANWPADSPAHVSYFRRMIAGPDYSLAQAQGTKPMLAPGQFACECNAAET